MQLNFKFTRGSIQLNLEKLSYCQSAYHRALARKPVAEHTPRETALVKNILIDPIIAHSNDLARVESTTEVMTPFTQTPWPKPLEPILPSLSPEEQTKYILKVLSCETAKGALNVLANIVNRPYFFYKVPTAVYHAGLVKDMVPHTLLSTICELILDDSEPSDDLAHAIVARSQTVFVSDLEMIHQAARLIATGLPMGHTRATGVLFDVLGREELKRRAATVQTLIEELKTGGEEVRSRWLEEAKSMIHKHLK